MPKAKPINPREVGSDEAPQASHDLVGMFEILHLGKGVYLQLSGSLVLIVAASAAVMTSARFLGALVQAVVESHGTQNVTRLAAIFLALESAAVVSQYFGRVNLAHATVEIAYRIRCQLFAKMQDLPIAYFDAEPLGRTITRLTADVEGIETFFGGTLARVLIASINIVAVLVAMLATDFRFGLVIVAVSLPALFFSVALRRPPLRWLRTYKRRSAHVNAKLAEYISGMTVIKIFGLEDWTSAHFADASQSQFEAGLKSMNWNSFIRPTAVFLCSLPTLLVLWLGGERVLSGSLELGLLIAFVRYGERFVAPIRTISTEIQNIQDAVVSTERVRRMLLEPEERDTLDQDGSLAVTLRGDVAFANVCMEYKPGYPVLKDISFVALAGMKVGLVGATGSGKTSTVNLLPRLYPFQAGQIFIDGQDIRSLNRQHLRRQLGYVSQDTVVFGGTLRENLLALSSPLDDAAVMAAARKTGLDQVIANFADGLNHVLLEGGENLSMGERQLVAFTRMLLRNPAILILDEATANIDTRCEVLIQKAIAEVMQGRTTFVVAHRLSTVIQCDLILVFRQGEIIEQGSHAELVRASGYYASLAAKQLLA